MTQAAKYLFDRNFESFVRSKESPQVLRERELREIFDHELEAARQEEYRRGLAEGEEQARDSLEAETREAVAQLAGSAQNILKRLDRECGAMRAEAVEIAVAAADCLASELVRREPTALLESLFSNCLEHLGDAPHVAIQVNDAFAERLQERLNVVAAQNGFAGRIIVMGDPGTAKGDCRIEWADGGISRDLESLRQNISEIVLRHLGTRGGGQSANGKAGAETGATPASTNPPTAVEAGAAPQTNGSGESS